MMRMRLAAAGMAASVLTDGVVGAALGTPGLAGAQGASEDATETPSEDAGDGDGWVEDALAPLVEDGTLTESQAEAVTTALEAARPARGGRHHGRLSLATAAEVLGMTEDELRTELSAGQTLAEVAAPRTSTCSSWSTPWWPRRRRTSTSTWLMAT